MWPPSVQVQAAEQYEQEFQAFQSGKYKESAQNWLQSSWQGDALQVCHFVDTFSKFTLTSFGVGGGIWAGAIGGGGGRLKEAYVKRMRLTLNACSLSKPASMSTGSRYDA